MAKKKKITPKLGDHVKVRHWPELQAQVIEERGPLGPKGSLVFRIRVEHDPEPHFIDVLEEQLEVIPDRDGATDWTRHLGTSGQEAQVPDGTSTKGLRPISDGSRE